MIEDPAPEKWASMINNPQRFKDDIRKKSDHSTTIGRLHSMPERQFNGSRVLRELQIVSTIMYLPPEITTNEEAIILLTQFMQVTQSSYYDYALHIDAGIKVSKLEPQSKTALVEFTYPRFLFDSVKHLRDKHSGYKRLFFRDLSSQPIVPCNGQRKGNANKFNHGIKQYQKKHPQHSMTKPVQWRKKNFNA
jgi:hypothetical protein